MPENDWSDDWNDADLDAELEAELQGHRADYAFTDGQLDWIEKNYNNTEQFMVSYGLKFYDDRDLELAMGVVETIMKDYY
jgi:hypothetical protein